MYAQVIAYCLLLVISVIVFRKNTKVTLCINVHHSDIFWSFHPDYKKTHLTTVC